MIKKLLLVLIYCIQCSASDYASEKDIKAVAEICSPKAAFKKWGKEKFSNRNEEKYDKLVKLYEEFLLQRDVLVKTEKDISNKVSKLKERRKQNFISHRDKELERQHDISSLYQFLSDNGVLFDDKKLAKIKTYKQAIKFLSNITLLKPDEPVTDYLNRKDSNALNSGSWNKFSNPLKHSPDDFRYIVHGIRENSKGEAILENADFFNNNDSLVLSVSVIDKGLGKLTTAIPSGVILEVPKTNIFASCDKNMGRGRAGSTDMNRKFGIADLDALLNNTLNEHNEITVESRVVQHELNSVIGIAGYFINIGSITWAEKRISNSRLNKIKEVCMKYNRPVVLIN